MSLFNTNVMHISLFVTFLMIVYLYIAGAYFICLLHILTVENISSNRTLDLHSSFMKEKVCCIRVYRGLEFFIKLTCHGLVKTENSLAHPRNLLSRIPCLPNSKVVETDHFCQGIMPLLADKNLKKKG